jgi:predicted O-methyltransferase YrrM
MILVNKGVEEYAQFFSSAEDELLAEIAAFTSHHPHAEMLSGHVQGKILETISCLLQPNNILEIGTFVGYSALCLAKGLQAEGKLHTIELRDDDADISQNFFIKGLNEVWDIVFIDADKVSYIDYYELTLPKIKQNGLIIADNVLFHGEVLEEKIKGKNAKAIHAFNLHVARDMRVEQVMLTDRDGLMLIRKL